MTKLKFTTSVVGIALATSILSSTTSAQGNESQTTMLPTQQESLSTSKLLDKKDVLKIVETNIHGYLQSDEQTKGKKLVASADFINLYDFENNLFAYMVPLLENGREIGYITVGAIQDGFATYEIFIDQQAVTGIKEKMKAKSNSKTSTQLVFLPPSGYVVKVTDGTTEKYFDISKEQEVDISDKVNLNKGTLQQNYKHIRKEENKSFINSIIQNSKTNADGMYYATVTSEDVRLVKEAQGQFVPVNTGDTVRYPNGIAYGGNQNWYANESHRSNGCGPVAGANIAQYLAQANPTKYGKLYAPTSMYKSSFVTHMDSLYTAINPGTFGELSVLEFAGDMEAFARGRYVSLSRMTSSAEFTLDNTATYIKNGLYSNSPVATLNTKKWSDYEYEWHWMTITKYFRDTADNRWIAASTWGDRRSIDYRVHFDAMKNGHLQGGLMWFL